MGSTRSHPLPPGIFVKMPSPPLARSQPISAWYNEAETIVAPSEFDGWTDKDFEEEIDRLNKRLKEIESERVHVDKEKYDGEVRVMTEEEVQNDPEMTAQVDKVDDLRAHFC